MKSIDTVAITGASGVIGKGLVEQIRRSGKFRIKVLCRRQDPQLSALEFGVGIEVTEGDLLVPDSFEGFFEPGCTVVHLAYLHGRGESENLAATANLLEACTVSNIKRLIHCSTAMVVGPVSEDIITEDVICQPICEYGITKLKIEKDILAAVGKSFDVVILRPTSVFGGGAASLVKLTKNLVAKRVFYNYVKSCLFGERRMNLVFMDNVIAAIIFIINQEQKFAGEVFIVSDDDSLNNNFRYVEQFITHELGLKNYRVPTVPVSLNFLSFILKILNRNNTNVSCNYSPAKLRGIGFKPPVKFESGLEKWVADLKSNLP